MAPPILWLRGSVLAPEQSPAACKAASVVTCRWNDGAGGQIIPLAKVNLRRKISGKLLKASLQGEQNEVAVGENLLPRRTNKAREGYIGFPHRPVNSGNPEFDVTCSGNRAEIEFGLSGQPVGETQRKRNIEVGQHFEIMRLE